METTATRIPLWQQPFRLLSSSGVMRAMLSGVAVVAVLTLVAKAASFFKDATVAHHFGTADSLDAFLLAFSMLSFLAAVIGGGLPESFLPVYAALRHCRGTRRAQRLAVQSALWNLVSLTVIAGIIFLAAPWIVSVTGRGFSVEKRALAVDAMRSLLPFLIFFGMTFHFSTWLRAEKKFALAALAPLLPPVIIITCLLFAGAVRDVRVLVIGTNAGVLLQLVLLALVLRKQMVAGPMRGFTLWEPGNKIVLANALPYLSGALLMNSAVIVDQTMAAWLEAGSVAVLTYSDKICGIVLAISATAASEAVFPFFADSVAKGEWLQLKKNLLHITGIILAITLPVALVLVLFAPQIVGILFERGSFHHADTERVAHVLRFAAMQIPFYIAAVLASKVAVSMQQARFTLIASFVMMGLNILFNALLMRHLGVAGIALSTAIVHCLSLIALYILIFRVIARKVREASLKGGATA